MPKFTFPSNFQVTFTPNHWSNLEKCEDLFKVIIFPYLSTKKKELGYPEDQRSLIIMDTFKGQDNEEMKRLCAKNNCELVIVPHNLMNKFQPLDISINQSAKKFISNKFNVWYADTVSKQLSNGVAPGDVKISLKLSDLKPLHARWIVETCNHLKHQKWFHYQRFRCCREQWGYHICKRCLHTSRKPFQGTETTTQFLVVFSVFFSWKPYLIFWINWLSYFFCLIYLPLSLFLIQVQLWRFLQRKKQKKALNLEN